MEGMPPVKYSLPQSQVELSTIVVHGHHFPFLAALQMYKKGLTRSWSTAPEDRDKLVCYWHTPVGTHFEYLYCATNRQHFKRYRRFQVALSAIPHPLGSGAALLRGLKQGRIPVNVASMTMHKQLSRSTVAPLLEKLPPANATYTLQVTGNKGRPVLRYVISHGQIKHVYHYIYKDGADEDD